MSDSGYVCVVNDSVFVCVCEYDVYFHLQCLAGATSRADDAYSVDTPGRIERIV